MFRRGPRPDFRHPVKVEMFGQPPLGARIADTVTDFLGSWRFIIIQTVFVAIWIVGNIYLIFNFDPFRSSCSTSRSRPRRRIRRRSSSWPAIAPRGATA